MPANPVTFSPLAIARAKCVLVGPPGAIHHRVTRWFCSLKETGFASAADLFRAETTRGTAAGAACARALAGAQPVPDEAALAAARRWFWSRKSTQGFALAGFPANARQAAAFDAWLDERDETLTACLWLAQSQDDALAEAQGRQVCPRDGSIVYPSLETATLPGHCELCREPLQDDGVRACAEVRAWFASEQPAARGVAAYFQAQGNLVEVDAARPAQAVLPELASLLGGLVVDR